MKSIQSWQADIQKNIKNINKKILKPSSYFLKIVVSYWKKIKIKKMEIIQGICLNSFLTSKDRTSVGTDLRPEFWCFLGDWTCNSATFGLALVVYDNCCVVLTVEESSIRSSPSASLSDNNSRVNFLSEFLNTLLAGSEDHITDGSSGKSVETASYTLNSDDHKVFGSWIISTIKSSSNW